jgi:hypothetical protein
MFPTVQNYGIFTRIPSWINIYSESKVSKVNKIMKCHNKNNYYNHNYN